MHTRRTALAAAFLALGFTASGSVSAANLNYTLYMSEANKTVTVPLYNSSYIRTFWIEGFTDVSGSAPNIAGVKLTANEGDIVNLTVYNNTSESHGFTLRNGTAASYGPAAGTPTVVVIPNTTIPANTSKSFSFTAPAAGSYFYYDPTTDAKTNTLNRSVGMYGAFIVYPPGQTSGSAGSLWTGGPTYKYDYTWVLSDYDKKLNEAERVGTTAFTGVYKPTYAFINGDFGVHAMKNTLVSPVVNVNDTVAIRVVNAGTIAHPLHFHGYHGELVSVNNVPQNRVLEKDVIDVPPMATMDLIFHIDQKGIYIVHDHTGMMVTQDGIYAEGMLAEFDVCKKEGGLIADDPHCPIPTIGVPNSWGGSWGGR